MEELAHLTQLDRQLFLYLNTLGNETWDGFWLFMTNKYYQIPIYFVLLILLVKNNTVKQLVAILAMVAILIGKWCLVELTFSNTL